MSFRREVIVLGHGDGDRSVTIEVTREDDTVHITAFADQQGCAEELEVFLRPDLFSEIREVMDTIEARAGGTRPEPPGAC